MLKLPLIRPPTPVKIMSFKKKNSLKSLCSFVGLVLKGPMYSRSRLTTGCDCLYCHGCILSPVEDFWFCVFSEIGTFLHLSKGPESHAESHKWVKVDGKLLTDF